MGHQEGERSPDRVAVAAEFADESMEANSEITGALIVGSAASGTDGPHSDVDLRLFNSALPADALPKRGAGRWIGEVYVDVSEPPDAWLDDSEHLAGCPRNGSAFRFGCVLRDPSGRVDAMLAGLTELFERPEYHARRMRIYRDIVERQIADTSDANESGFAVEMCRSLPFAVLSAATVPAICVGVSPNSVRGLTQLRSISPPLYKQLFGIVGPSDLNGGMVRKWLDDGKLISVCNSDVFFRHILDQVSWIASEGEHFAAYYPVGALVNIYSRDFNSAEGTNPGKIPPGAEAIAREWLADAGWGDRQANREKLEALRGFVDGSIEELFPHPPGLLAKE